MNKVNQTKTAPEAPTPDTQDDGVQAHKQADTRDVDRFRDSMKRDRKERGRDGENRKEGGHPMQPGTGDAILRGLQGRQDAPKADMPTSATDTTRAIVDRILVADPTQSGKQEVRITLNEDVLAGTEIRMTKDGNNLHVNLVTGNNDSFRFLTAQRDGLHTQLSQRLSDNVTVAVTHSDDAASTGQDGRSRERRNLYEEQEDE